MSWFARKQVWAQNVTQNQLVRSHHVLLFQTLHHTSTPDTDLHPRRIIELLTSGTVCYWK